MYGITLRAQSTGLCRNHSYWHAHTRSYHSAFLTIKHSRKKVSCPKEAFSQEG